MLFLRPFIYENPILIMCIMIMAILMISLVCYNFLKLSYYLEKAEDDELKNKIRKKMLICITLAMLCIVLMISFAPWGYVTVA